MVACLNTSFFAILKRFANAMPENPFHATTSCKNVETLSRKNNLSCFKSLLVTGLWDKILTSPLPPFKVVPPSFEHGLVLLATLKRGGGGFTSTRSWTSYLSQNTVLCLKYFCNWLSHLRFTFKSRISTSQLPKAKTIAR